MSSRTTCVECEGELWSPAEDAAGYCIGCQLRAMSDDGDGFDEDEEDDDE